MVTVTIGIPAFNEEDTIHFLLQQVTSQRQEQDVNIVKIVVLSDGSTDGTAEIVRKWLPIDRRIQLYTHGHRKGMSATVNDIFLLAKGDILLILDADASLDNPDAVVRMANALLPIGERRACVPDVFPSPPSTLVERAGYFSAKLRANVISLRPYYSFHVCFALTRPLFSEIAIPDEVIPTEAYVFFRCIQLGAKVTYLKDVRVLYREPSTLHDFLNQRIRYEKEKEQLRALFGNNALDQMSISKKTLTEEFLRCVRDDTLSGILWLVLRTLAKLGSITARVSVRYEVASSTKKPG